MSETGKTESRASASGAQPTFSLRHAIWSRVTALFSDGLKLVRFGIVGVVSTLIYSAAFVVYRELLAADTLVVSVMSYMTSMAWSFLAHRHYTFRQSTDFARQLMRFAVMSAIGFAMTVGIMEVVVKGFGLHYGYGILAVDVLVVGASFLAMQYFVFVDRREGRVGHDDKNRNGAEPDPGHGGVNVKG